jgi:Leucine-rich repeat (LRR) protein
MLPWVYDHPTAQVLRVSHNKLANLPPEIGQLEGLEVLAADHNMLSAVPGG